MNQFYYGEDVFVDEIDYPIKASEWILNNLDVDSLIVLIKDLIDRREDVDIIKKFINGPPSNIKV